MEAFFAGIGANVRHGPLPLYNPREDYIQLPHSEHFQSLDRYYDATRLHESVHWTGPPSRLNRQFGKRFGHHAYAFEELVAELGSAFLSADLGLAPELGHQARYIKEWIAILSNDRQAIVMTAARATENRGGRSFSISGARPVQARSGGGLSLGAVSASQGQLATLYP